MRVFPVALTAAGLVACAAFGGADPAPDAGSGADAAALDGAAAEKDSGDANADASDKSCDPESLGSRGFCESFDAGFPLATPWVATMSGAPIFGLDTASFTSPPASGLLRIEPPGPTRYRISRSLGVPQAMRLTAKVSVTAGSTLFVLEFADANVSIALLADGRMEITNNNTKTYYGAATAVPTSTWNELTANFDIQALSATYLLGSVASGNVAAPLPTSLISSRASLQIDANVPVDGGRVEMRWDDLRVQVR